MLNGLVATTAFKYLVAIAASAIAQYLGVAEGDVTGVLTQLVSLLMAVWGIWESTRNKAVLNGEVIRIPSTAVPEVAKKVDTAIRNANGDVLVGRVR